MKAKLLKKIRKRFSIVEYTEVDINASEYLVDCKEKFGLPFFILEDLSWVLEGECYNKYGFSTKTEAIEKIRYITRKEYRQNSVRNKVEKRKVWWISK